MDSHRTHQPLRVALYSHDTQGLGHLRRNLAIAAALSKEQIAPAVLMISGTTLGAAYTNPPNVDFVALPAVAKDAQGRYCSRSLPLPIEQLISLRMNTIHGALESFAPDVLIVDKVPTGLLDEMIPALQTLRKRGQTRSILGLRDVLDDPITTRREWEIMENTATINSLYDGIWVYGDPAIFDPIQEYGLGQELQVPVHYTGYLDRSQIQAQRVTVQSSDPLLDRIATPKMALCMLGGGEDGAELAHTFARAELPADTTGVLVTGPYMCASSRKELQQIAARQPRLQVLEFTPQPELLLQRADAVVSMGGYNSVCEILAHHKRALVVPRVKPRLEQLIRAERLQKLGYLDLLHPDELKPKRISQWLRQITRLPALPVLRIDLNGFARLPQLLTQLAS